MAHRRGARLTLPDEPPHGSHGTGRFRLAAACGLEILTWARRLCQEASQGHAQAAARFHAGKMRTCLRTQQARLASYQRDHRLPSLALLDPDFVLTSDRPTLFAAASGSSPTCSLKRWRSVCCRCGWGVR